MSEVLIVAKTQMRNALCVGGLCLETHSNLRLLNRGNRNQPEDTEFEIGQIWDIDFIDRNPVFPPHNEDIIVLGKNYLRDIENISEYILDNNLINWDGGSDLLFEGLLNWTDNGSGYCTQRTGYPPMSVGYWISDRDLSHYTTVYNKSRYRYSDNRSLTFKGLVDPIDTIPSGTIIRVSLSRPKDIRDVGEEESFLQLSGWFID